MDPIPLNRTTVRSVLTALLLFPLSVAAQSAPEKLEANQVAAREGVSPTANAVSPIVPPTIQAWFDSSQQRIWSGFEGSITLVRMAALLGENPYLRQGAEAWVAELEKQSPYSEKAHECRLARRHARLILGRSWGEPAGLTPLLQACLAALKAEKPAKPVYGSLEGSPYLAFCVLNEIAVTTLSPKGQTKPPNSGQLPDAAFWREAVEVLLTHPITKDHSSDRYKLFQISIAVEGLITDSTLEKFLDSPFDDLSGLAAEVYRARGDRERLAELGMSLKPRPQLIALGALAWEGAGSNQVDPFASGVPAVSDENRKEKRVVGPQERKFWSHVFQTQPLEASALLRSHQPSAFVDYPSALASVRAFWEKELNRKALEERDFPLTKQPGYPWIVDHVEPQSFEFLMRSPESRNKPLLRLFLGYRGYVAGSNEYEKKEEDDEEKTVWEPRDFNIRRRAADALREMGEPVPDDLVLEVKAMLPKDVPEENLSGGWYWKDKAGPPKPNLELPAHVVAEEGKLTLFADYDRPEKDGVPLYLVNRTFAPIALPTSDGSLNVKLERQLPSGAWERAQERYFSFCGNSYGSRALPPGMFMSFHGYQPRGELAQASLIRFMCYDQVPMMSNAGTGFFSPQDVERAKGDELSLRDVPRSLKYGFGQTYKSSWPELSQGVATLRLAEHLGEFPNLRERPGAREKAQKWLEQLEEFPDPTAEESQAIALIKPILGREWGERKGLGVLLKACLDALKSDGEAAKEFGSLARESKLVWTVVGEIAEIDSRPARFGTEVKNLNRKLWAEVLDLAVEKMMAKNQIECAEISKIFQQTTLVDEILSSEVFEKLLQVDDPLVTELAADALVRRGMTEKLAELGLKIPETRKIPVLVSLAQKNRSHMEMTLEESTGGGLRKPGPLELELWEQTIKTQGTLLASKMISQGKLVPDDFKEKLINAVRTHWQSELSKPDRSEKDFELTTPEARQVQSLLMLAWSRLPQDFELIRSLLGHRGYMKYETTRYDSNSNETGKVEVHSYVIRRAAAEALRQYDKPVPKGIVYEVELKPDGSPR